MRQRLARSPLSRCPLRPSLAHRSAALGCAAAGQPRSSPAGAPHRRPMSSSSTAPDVAVLMCGLPGRMGHSVAEAVVRRWGP